MNPNTPTPQQPQNQPGQPVPPAPQPTPAPAAAQPPVQVNNPLNVMSSGEQNIFQVKRHPIGILGIYLTFAVLVVLVGAGAVLAPDALGDYDTHTVKLVGMAAFLAAVVFSAIFTLIARVVYYGNSWILTSDSLTQVRQVSLFDRQNSQLSLGNLEDISASQDGIFPHMFNYGTLKVETAGEHSKFIFPYCPDPNRYAQQILAAREKFEQGEHYQPAQPQGANITTS